MNDAITAIYSRQLGGELPYFAGNPSQWGGGILQTIARFAFPVLKRFLGVATNTAEDVIEGRKTFKESLIDNTMDEVENIIPINRKRQRVSKKNIKRASDLFDRRK